MTLSAIDVESDSKAKIKAKKPPTPKTAVNFAGETPLMFSRTSSLGSLGSQEAIVAADDKSSVVSEFSRLASGIISPSEIPESPLMSVPHSPRRQSVVEKDTNVVTVEASDELNPFAVENTPAHFSCATSLSNLSLDDEPKITKDCLVKEMQLMSHPSEEQEDEYVLNYSEDAPMAKDQSGVEFK